MKKALLLMYVINGINDTANVFGVVPPLLVLGVIPSYLFSSRPVLGQQARLKIIVDVSLEMV